MAKKLQPIEDLDLNKLVRLLDHLKGEAAIVSELKAGEKTPAERLDLALTKPAPEKQPGYKRVVFVSNYDSTRVGMYVGGILQHEEHGDSYKHGVAYTYFLLKGKRKKIQWEDFFRHAADLLTCAGTPFDWREADPSWLRRRKHFPQLLGEVKFNAALVGNN